MGFFKTPSRHFQHSPHTSPSAEVAKELSNQPASRRGFFLYGTHQLFGRKAGAVNGVLTADEWRRKKRFR